MSVISYGALTGISWIFTGLAVLLTCGRFWIRCKIIKKVSWDDAAHLLGLLFLLAQVSIVSSAATLVYRSINDEAGANNDPHKAENLLFLRLNVASILITWFCLYAIKISFLLLYYRIFQISRRFIQAWWLVLGTVILTFCILILGSITLCGSPLALENVESCLSPAMSNRQTVFVIYSCALNIFSDLAIMALPLAMIKGLQMRTPAKLGLAGIFSCAIITIVFDILRTVETDRQGDIVGSTALWTNLESAVAVIVSCLPSFTALFTTKNARNGAANRGPYRQRSLAISESAKPYMSAGSSLRSGSDGRSSAAGDLEKSTTTSSSSIINIDAHAEGTSNV